MDIIDVIKKGDNTKDPVNKVVTNLILDQGFERFGLMSNYAWYSDPKRLTFTFARYKFVSKILSGKNKVLEVGCGDALGSRIVLQEVKSLTAIDYDPLFITDIKERMSSKWQFDTFVHDILQCPVPGSFDGIYSLDVLEHISKEQEHQYMKNILSSLSRNGVLIIGIPSLESQAYASSASREGHINCKSGPDLKNFLYQYFENIFLFSMNDETIHTGFYPMAHYLFAVCCMKKSTS